MRKKILIIDDDEAICDEISSSLEDEGYDVSISNDGLEGNTMASSGKFDVLLLDLYLPSLSGLEILKGLRQKKCGLHVIVVTGQVDEAQLRKGGHLDGNGVSETLRLADGLLCKPFCMDKLLSMIKEAVKHTKRSEEKPSIQ